MLTKAQINVLKKMEEGSIFLETITPETPFFRSLGASVPCRLNHWIGTNEAQPKRVNYTTFVALFKGNYIDTCRHTANPPTGTTQYRLTELAKEILVHVR